MVRHVCWLRSDFSLPRVYTNEPWGRMGYVFIATLSQFANRANSQTLQFSQVLLVSTTQTVPANKVWKVESYTPNAGIINFHYIVVNSNNSIVGAVENYIHIYSHTFPMWLPAGTTLAAGQNVHFISVVEFTVVP